MQLYADVIRRPIGVIGSDQGPALGSAIHAAVAAGAYPDIRVAAKAMGKRRARACTARTTRRAAVYDRLYAEYSALHDYFGRGANDVMHRLRAIRREAGPMSDVARRPTPSAICVRRCARCTASSSGGGSSRGRAATSALACRARI